MKRIKKCFLIISFVILISFTYFLIRPAVAEANAGNFIQNIEDNANSLLSRGANKLGEMGIDIDLDFIDAIKVVLYITLCVVLIIVTLYKAIKYGLSNAADRAAAKRDLGIWILICVLGIGVYPLFELIVLAFDSSSYTENIVQQLGNTQLELDSSVQNSTFLLILNTIYRIIQVGAIGAVLIKFTAVAIKYFGRSAEGRAEVKHGDLQRTLILAVIVFGAVGFFEIIYQAFYG